MKEMDCAPKVRLKTHPTGISFSRAPSERGTVGRINRGLRHFAAVAANA